MKRILSVLLVALMLLGMLPWTPIHAHAADGSVELSIAGTTGTKSSDSSSISWTDSGITFTNKKGSTAIRTSDSDHYRIYAGSSATFSSTAGNITKIEVTCTSSSYASVFQASAGSEATVSGSVVTITPTASSDTYTISSFTKQTRVNKIVVYYEAAASACEHTNTTENSDGYAATCTETGMTNSVTCNDCGETVTAQEEIPALGHSYVDGVCQNCNNVLPVVSFSVPSQVTAVDSITADENGIVTLPEAADYTGKYSYTFVGWTTGTVSDTEEKPTLYTADSEYTPAGDITLYAVYTYTVAGTGGASEYVLTDISAISPTDVVVVTMTYTDGTIYALSSANGTSKAPAATVVNDDNNDGKLDNNAPADDLKWNIGGSSSGYILYVNGSTDTWLYCTSTNNGVRVGTNADNTFVVDSASGYLKHTATSRYLGVYRTTPDWRCYANTTGNTANQTLGFYVLTSGGTEYYTTTLEDTDATCTHENTTEVTVDATCTDPGSVTVTCDDCGAVISETKIPATGHTEVIDAAVDATCATTGLTEGSHCSVCDAVITAQQTVAATGEHTYENGACSVCGAEEPSTGATEWQLVTDASTLKAGDRIVIVAKNADVALSTTQNNNNRAVTEITKNTANNTVGVIDGVQIITLENGTTDGTFAFYVEGDSTGYLYAASSGSNYLKTETTLSANSSWLITIADGAATVKAQGSNTRNWLRYNPTSDIFSCYSSGQGDIAIYKEVVLCEHATTTDVAKVPATCTSVGYTAGKQCTECGDYTEGHEVIEMLAHSYDEGEVTTAAGCTTDGVKTYTCTAEGCGDSYTESIPATGHTKGDTVTTAPTCTTDGEEGYICSVCGVSVTETIPATGHSWNEGEITTAATCETAGVKTYTCSNAGCTKTEEIPAIGHIWDEGQVTTAATCDTAGSMLYTCQNDNSHTRTEEIPAQGHSYDADGVCTVCGSKVSYFQLIDDYTKILSGGEYIIAARSGDTFYALDTAEDNQMGSKEITISGTGTEMKVIYAEGLPIWNIGYYENANNCFTLYNSVTKTYLTGGSSTSLGTSSDAWAWTFCDTDNSSAGEDGEYAVVQSDDSIAKGASAFVLVSNTVSADRAISYRNSAFYNYSVRTSGYNRELYFFKLVEAGATEYTVTYKENGTETMTQSIPVEENVIELPESTGAAMPSGYTNFVGWVTMPHAESLVAPTTIYKPGTTVSITEDTTFFALYTREDADAEGQAMSYHRVTDISQVQIGERYIIVGLDTNGNYWAMSADQLSDDRGASAVTPDENGVITFLPEDKVAVFELEQGYEIGSFAFLDLNMNQFLYCSSSDTNASLKSQTALNSAASFVIQVVYDETTGYYSTIAANATVDRNHIMFNTIEQNSKLFSSYKLHADTDDEGNLEQNTFLYVGKTDNVAATYYATGLCDHQWNDGVTTQPGCTNAGYTVYTCTVCGEVKIENVAAHGHSLGEATVINPTCTEAGSSTSTCINCGDEWKETIPALGHTEVTDAGYAATCTTTGLTEGSHCSVCNEVLTAQEEIPALGHTEEIDAAVDATCTTTGLTEGSHCSVCNEVLTAQEEIPALGHDYEGTAAYYTSDSGKQIPRITYQCSRCDENYSIDLKFAAADLVLTNTLVINFKMEQAAAAEDGFTDIRAEFEYGKRVGEYQIPHVYLEDTVLSGDRYAFPCRYITPSQIGDTVYVKLYGTYDGVEYCFEMEYGVSQYCYSQLENSSDAKLHTLLVDLLYYCDYARVYSNYKADEPVTTNLTEAQKALASEDGELKSVTNTKYAVIDNPTATWKAVGLVMTHSIRMQLRFALPEGMDVSNLSAKVTVDGQTISGQIVASETYAGQYVVVIDDLAARQMSSNVLVTIYDGDTVISNTICYSIESYAYAKQNDTNEKLANLVKAMMRYGNSAAAYLN